MLAGGRSLCSREGARLARGRVLALLAGGCSPCLREGARPARGRALDLLAGERSLRDRELVRLREREIALRRYPGNSNICSTADPCRFRAEVRFPGMKWSGNPPTSDEESPYCDLSGFVVAAPGDAPLYAPHPHALLRKRQRCAVLLMLLSPGYRR